MAQRTTLRILGVMTGTSCDGLDAACIESDGDQWKSLWCATAKYPPHFRKRVLEFQKPGSTQKLQTWLELNRSLGEWYGITLRRLIEDNSPEPDIIANHGQTIAHFPSQANAKVGGSTLQLGDPTRIGHITGLTVVSNFREGDMAAGGQGAPLTPLFHQILARQLGYPDGGIAIHNIGGISNLTYVGPHENILAFDTGPGNIWIDAATEIATRGKQTFDKNGHIASTGAIDWNMIKKILRHPYFKKAFPKSTGRDEFPFEFFLSKKTRSTRGADLVATATALTVESIAQSYDQAIFKKKLPLEAIFFCGGGAKNSLLMQWLAHRLPYVRVKTLDEVGGETGFDSQWVEAQAFAYFGFLSLLGRPLGGPWTGAKGFAPPGHLIPGLNWVEVVEKIQTVSRSFS